MSFLAIIATDPNRTFFFFASVPLIFQVFRLCVTLTVAQKDYTRRSVLLLMLLTSSSTQHPHHRHRLLVVELYFFVL